MSKPKSQPIAIIGAGGLGRELRILVERNYKFAGFIDDKVLAENYLGNLSTVYSLLNNKYIIAIGSPQLKKQIAEELNRARLNFVNIISKHAVLPAKYLKGIGSIICDGVISTVSCSIGSHVLININSTIGHDVAIGNYCSIMPGSNISGGVTIGEATLIGSGAIILQGVTIGSNVKVGAGAVVTKSVPDNCTVVGVPAKPIKRKD